MLKKFALCEAVPLNINVEASKRNLGLVKTAAGRVFVDPDSDKARIIQAEIDKHPTALFFRAKAIKADESNSNGDYFSTEELKKSYKSFEGVPFFTNHDNQNVENARGKIIHAEWVPEEKSIYTISFVDREAFPHICRSIEEEYVSGVSMGAINGESLIVMSDLSEKRISDINEGEEILSAYGNKKRVKRVHNEYLGKSMYSFELATYHKSPLFTDDHPVFMIEKQIIEANKKEAISLCNNSQYENRMGSIEEPIGEHTWRTRDYNSDAKFTKADSIQQDDFLLIPSKFKIEDGASLNSDFYYVVGAYLGDGHLKKDRKGEYEGISFCLGPDEIELAQKITTILKKYSKSNPCDLVCEDINGLYISLYDRKLAKWFAENIGRGSSTKRLKFNLKFKEDALNLLSGYLDTHGCIAKKTNINHTPSYQFSSANIGLLEDIQSLLISLDCISRITPCNRALSENRVVKINTIEHTLAVGSNNSELFNYSIKFKLNNCHNSKIKEGKTFILDANGNKFMACPVKSISVADFNEPVYDLTVEDDECYIADGLAVHNCSVEYSICNICENRAEKTEDYCWHIRERKGRAFSGKARNVKTGETKDFKNEPVFEYNYGIKFIELSAVVDPACTSCRIEGLISNEDYMKKVANIENALRMVKTAAMDKNASQEEIQQLTQCLETLEGIAVGLIQNRQQVEVDFASDLVDILSELQKFTDELIGAGYGNVQGNIPGVAPEPTGEVPQEGAPPPAGNPAVANPVAEEAPLAEEVGSVSGSPTSPLVQSPQLPITAPAKPMAFNSAIFRRIASNLSDLRDNMEKNTGEDEMGKRRTKVERIEQKKAATEVLSNSWQEKQEFFEYINRVPSVQDNNNKVSIKKRDDSFIIVAENKENPEQEVWTFENLTDREKQLIIDSPKEAALHFLETFANNVSKKTIKEGDKVMTTETREAGAQSVNKEPQVVQEAQLEQQRDLYHARTDSEQNSITEKQLSDDGGSHQRTGEQEVITEAQLEAKSNKLHPREEDGKEVVTEAQLRDDKSSVSPRKEAEPNVVTQKQLDDNGNRTGTDPEVVTEKQLDEVAAPWERAANRDASMFKGAGEHLKEVINVLANTSIATGCTPEEVCEVAGSLVDSTKERYELGNAILEKAEGEDIDCSKRLAYWSAKNIKVASVGRSEIADAVVRGLRRVASDETINPEVIIDALDVVSDSEDAQAGVSKVIDVKLENAKSETVKASRKDEIKKALAETVHGKEDRDEERKEITASLDKEDAKLTREAEREILDKVLDDKEKSPDTMIETDFSELGCEKTDPSFRTAIKNFARGALASQNTRLAAVTNVTINGDTISIAVQTDAGEESVEIPVGQEISPVEEEIVPEGDLDGEGLGASLGEEVPPAPAPASTMASKSGKMTRKAQTPMGGGVPGTPGEVAGGPGGNTGAPDEAPMGEPVEALTMDEDVEISDEIPTAGEQQMPYSICPECGSSDVDIEKEASGNIKGGCNNCGAEYEALIKKEVEFTIIKPTRSVGEEGVAGEPEVPEVPALPVAAQTKLDKGVLTRIASNRDKYGLVCPACGMGQCKVASENNGHTEFECPACGTQVEKDVIVNVNNPDDNFLRVKWDLVPNVEGCEDCVEAASKFASLLKVEGLMKQASNGDTKFPRANCMERIARQYGGNSVATFGPCKGKPLADCVCGQLEKLALTKVRHLEKLASVYTQADPMDECIEDQKKKGYEVKEATTICNCLKKKFASEEDDNPFLQAFAEDISSGKEKILTAQDVRTINDILTEDIVEEEDVFEDVDIADELEPLPTEEVEEGVEETVNLEVSKETAEEIADAAIDATEATEVEVEGVEIEIEEDVPEMDSTTEIEVADEASSEEEKELAMAMQNHKLRRVGEEVVKVAATPKKVEDISGDVKAGVPRSKATQGGEGTENIDVPMSKPSVPRANAEMGKEGPSNINPSAGMPDVAVDSSYMGEEKSVQKDMPAINNEVKGTVIAEVEVEDGVIKEAKQLKEVDTVEKDVKAGVPRSKATQGEEGAENIDVPMSKPSVPRNNAEMGEEGAENINPKADGPDVPVDSSYMGEEKSVQKDMPAMNDEMLKNVQQSNNKEKQQERIANARRMKAVEVAAKLLATSRITEGAYDKVIEALSSFQIDKIASAADSMYPMRKAAESKSAPEGHSIPAIVQESAPVTSSEDNLQTRLSSSFTIGNKSFDENLTIYGEK